MFATFKFETVNQFMNQPLILELFFVFSYDFQAVPIRNISNLRLICAAQCRVSSPLNSCVFFSRPSTLTRTKFCTWHFRTTERKSSRVRRLFSSLFLVCYRVARWFIFKPKIPTSGKFWRALEWKMFAYLKTI
jgi:hypothetical protein